MSAPGFWNDQQKAQAVVQQVKAVKSWLEPFEAISGRVQSACELEEMLALEPDEELAAEVERETSTRSAARSKRSACVRCCPVPTTFATRSWRSAPAPAAPRRRIGRQMLMRMYTRWAERKGYAIEILDLSDGEEAGIKGAVLEIKGLYAYRILESGSGRASARAHLAVRRAGAAAYELRIGVRLSRGRQRDQHRDPRRGHSAWMCSAPPVRGGQHVNKTSSAVRLDAHPERHRHVVAGRAVAAQEQGDGDEEC